jgi:hypothetical protein
MAESLLRAFYFFDKKFMSGCGKKANLPAFYFVK